MHNRVEALRRVPLFAELGDEELERLAQVTQEIEAAEGQVLTQPGTKGTGMFFVAEGVAEVESKAGPVELGPGQFFGELALMKKDATRTARVRAKTPMRCLALDRPSFQRLVAENPQVATALLEVALDRLAENAGIADTPASPEPS
jgi:CRP-like cAMP-binding protein